MSRVPLRLRRLHGRVRGHWPCRWPPGRSSSWPSPAAASTVGGTATIAAPGATARGALGAGGSSTMFTVALPANASCPADTAHHGYHVYSYLVPKGTDLSAVKFIDFPSRGYGLVDTAGSYYGAINTALGTGQIIGIPNDFEWGPLAGSDGGAVPLSKLVGGPSHGVWEAGIACATTRGALARYWNTQVTFTADARRRPRLHLARGSRLAGRVHRTVGGTDRHAAGRGAGTTSAASSTGAGARRHHGRRPGPTAACRRTVERIRWRGSTGGRTRAGRQCDGRSVPGGSGANSSRTAAWARRHAGRQRQRCPARRRPAVPGPLALAVGLLFLLRRNWRTGSPSAARGSGAMTLTQTALDREMLLVAVPGADARGDRGRVRPRGGAEAAAGLRRDRPPGRGGHGQPGGPRSCASRW